MGPTANLYCCASTPAATRAAVVDALAATGIVWLSDAAQAGAAVAVFAEAAAPLEQQLRVLCAQATVLAICVHPAGLRPPAMWAVMATGVADLLLWPAPPYDAHPALARLQRWQQVRKLADSALVAGSLVGVSAVWRALVCDVVEVAAFSDSCVLVQGETGTGKEAVAQLIHLLDRAPGKPELTVVDCTTIAPELSGSEFFGHERGAYTGAANARDGAFALADGGVLFLDEIGELGAGLQAQLLRVIQERKYKRIGSNVWQRSQFRLVCATNRDLATEVAGGRFRADLYYRIAAWRCTTPPLRARRDDILPLVRHFLAQLGADAGIALDPAVRAYLLARDYPGNVRELRQLVSRIWHRHTGTGPLTVGAVPPEERLPPGAQAAWPDSQFAGAIARAVELGIGLKAIREQASDCAMQCALEQCGGNLQLAAQQLGVTDRALQMRRANQRGDG
ncbi:MAG TPA: sigma 54-interacting transcriptional regulator [Burkholderiaceae bacterium]